MTETLKHLGYDVYGARNLAQAEGFIIGNLDTLSAVIMDGDAIAPSEKLIASLCEKAPLIVLLDESPVLSLPDGLQLDSMTASKGIETAAIAQHIEAWHAHEGAMAA